MKLARIVGSKPDHAMEKLERVKAKLERRLAELQPKIDALEQTPELERAAREAARVHQEYRQSDEYLSYYGRDGGPREKAIALMAEADRTRDVLAKVVSEGREASREAAAIKAKLDAESRIRAGLGEIDRLKREDASAAAKRDRAARLLEEIQTKIGDLEQQRADAIDRGATERLDGKPDTSSGLVVKLDAELAIERAAKVGAQRALANATERLGELPELIRQVKVTVVGAVSDREELRWMAELDDVAPAAARYLAARRFGGWPTDELTILPEPPAIAAALAQLETELFGAHSEARSTGDSPEAVSDEAPDERQGEVA